MKFYRLAILTLSIPLGNVFLPHLPVNAQNTAINEQFVQQEAAAVGYGNSVNNRFTQNSQQLQRNPFYRSNNEAFSSQYGVQTGVAEGVRNRVTNQGVQNNVQRQFNSSPIYRIAPVGFPRH